MDTKWLNLPEELILMLLNEQTGYFHQISGWTLNCAVIGAVLANLSLKSRIDTDMESLHLLDSTETGDPSLDICLKEIADGTAPQNTRYWVERLTVHADDIIESTLDRLVYLEILRHHDGGFWTLSPANWHADLHGYSKEHTARQFIRSRIGEAIFTDVIPDAKDIIIIGLINSCDLFRFIFEIDENVGKRIEQICQMELIGRTISAAVKETISSPLLRHPSLTKEIPSVSLFKLISNPNLWNGNLAAMFKDLAEEYGSVFRINPLFRKPMTFIAGTEINRWVHRKGRLYLTSRKYYLDVEKEYGGVGLIPSLDGAEHFSLRRALKQVYSNKKLENEMGDLIHLIGNHMKSHWKVGSDVQLYNTSRLLVNSQIMPLLMSTDTNDIYEDLMRWKNSLLTYHIVLRLPKLLVRLFLKTPKLKRGAKAVDIAVKRIQQNHTPAQRAGCPRDLADETLGLHASDPQFIPEANIKFMLSGPMLGSQYLSDTLGCAIYAMITQPELLAKIRSEAEAVFSKGGINAENLTLSDIDITHRFVLECQRMYPVIYMVPRHVVNTHVVDGIQLPVGELVFVAHGAVHFMEDAFPDPFKFDIDRYLPPRNEHRSPSYAPFGFGTHTCLGMRWVVLQLAVNLLMIAHYFKLELADPNFKFKFNAFPSLSVSHKLKVRIAEQLHEFPV